MANGIQAFEEFVRFERPGQPGEPADMTFFHDEGCKNLLVALVRGSIVDVIQDRKNAKAPAEISMGARWLGTPDGIYALEFMLPDIPGHRVVAEILQNPEGVLKRLNNFKPEPDEECETSSDQTAQVDADEGVEHAQMTSSKSALDEVNFEDDSPQDDEELAPPHQASLF